MIERMCENGRRCGWKRSNSDTSLDRTAASSPKRRCDRDRSLSRSVEDLRETSSEEVISSHNREEAVERQGFDAEERRRDLLQLALDEICDIQRRLREENAGDSDEDDGDVDDEEEEDDLEDVPVGPTDRDVVLAGFEFCTKEALKFLIEEEHLGPEHPAVRQLTAHLSSQKRSLNCGQVLANYFNSTYY